MFDTNLGVAEMTDADAQKIVGGPTAVEYAVMLALIIVVCLTATPGVGQAGNLGRQLS